MNIRIASLNTTELCKQMVIALFITMLALGGLYIYLVSKSVVNVVVRKEVEQQIAEVNSQIGKLELSYLEKKQSITLARARTLGFREVAEKTYVNGGSLFTTRRALSSNDEL